MLPLAYKYPMSGAVTGGGGAGVRGGMATSAQWEIKRTTPTHFFSTTALARRTALHMVVVGSLSTQKDTYGSRDAARTSSSGCARCRDLPVTTCDAIMQPQVAHARFVSPTAAVANP